MPLSAQSITQLRYSGTLEPRGDRLGGTCSKGSEHRNQRLLRLGPGEWKETAAIRSQVGKTRDKDSDYEPPPF